MADRSSIEWTQATWNPTTGCDRVSRGCDNCYALALARRLHAMGSPKYQTNGDPRTSGPGFGLTVHYAALNVPRQWRTPRMIFVNSMSDLFHARVPVELIRDVFDVIAQTPQHTYQVLTKQARRLRRLTAHLDWPPNIWIGVSVEDAQVLDRVDDLRAVPAAVRFLTCEPLLGPLDALDLAGIHWLIAGGESGKNARPIDQQWVRSLRDKATGVRAVLLQAMGWPHCQVRRTPSRRPNLVRIPGGGSQHLSSRSHRERERSGLNQTKLILRTVDQCHEPGARQSG